jgi:hypothetical protein
MLDTVTINSDDAKLIVAVVGGSVGIISLLFALARELYARRAERPVLICHERQTRTFPLQGTGWQVQAEVENASSKHAFNIRFGVELNGVRFPWSHEPADRDRDGSRWNFLAPGETTDPQVVAIPSALGWSGGGNPDPGRSYWCRYESTTGALWETRNPWDRTGQFEIKRIRRNKIRRRLERRKRKRMMKHASANISATSAAMLAEMEAHKSEKGTDSTEIGPTE